MLWIPLLAVVLLVPTVSWLLHAPFDAVSGSSYILLTLIGQITGIIGAQLFAFALILSARLKFLEFFFGGLDRMYVIHHRVGTVAFSFLAVHPIILMFRFLEDGAKEMMKFLLPFGETSLAQSLGIYSLLGMIVLLFVTFYGVIFSYPTLKTAHRFFGFFFFLGALHMYLIPSSMSSDMVLKVSCLTTAAVGLLAYCYRTLFGKLFVKKFAYTVSSVTEIGQGISEITLTPDGVGLKHVPGQFAVLSLLDKKLSNEEHPFTISSADKNGIIRFSIKSLGDYTSLVRVVTPGVKALVEGPFGEFYYGYGKEKQVWVAGGVGVTPFASMAEDLLQKDAIDYQIDFYYSIKNMHDSVYDSLFNSLAKKHPTFHYHLIPSDTKGYVTGELLSKEVSDLLSRDIFICGPPGMMDALSESLVAFGVSKKNIRSERFALLK
jgi:predicted ferric reductase